MFALKFGSQVVSVRPILAEEFTPAHHDTLKQMRYEQETLIFPDPRWQSVYLGQGEEKAVFCVCDHELRVFALELIDERHYLNGRFVGGRYFFTMRLPAMTGVKAHTDSEFGLTFTGLVKVREFAHGYVWAHFSFDPARKTLLDDLYTAFLQSMLRSQFRDYQAHYADVHDWNILFEIRAWTQPGIPLLIRTCEGRLAWVKIGLQPIDVR